jgi:hypothetical protein
MEIIISQLRGLHDGAQPEKLASSAAAQLYELTMCWIPDAEAVATGWQFGPSFNKYNRVKELPKTCENHRTKKVTHEGPFQGGAQLEGAACCTVAEPEEHAAVDAGLGERQGLQF